MADKKVTELTAITNLSGDDLLLIVNDPTGTPASRKITHKNFFANVVSDVTHKGKVTTRANTFHYGTNMTIEANVNITSTLTVNNNNVMVSIQDRMQVANVVNTYTPNTTFQSALANTNSAVADRMQVANTTSLINAIVTGANSVSKTFANAQNMVSTLSIDSTGAEDSSGVKVANGAISIYTATGTPSYVDFYCETNNAHRVRLQSPAHADYSGNITVKLPTTGSVLATTTDLATANTSLNSRKANAGYAASNTVMYSHLANTNNYIATKANINSPSFTGTVTAITTQSNNVTVQANGGLVLTGGGIGATPSSSNATNESVSVGTVWFSNTHLYIATDQDTIKRVALSTF